MPGVCEVFKEIVVKTKNPLRVVREFRRDLGSEVYRRIGTHPGSHDQKGSSPKDSDGGSPAWLHQLFRVRLKGTKEYFAIDLTNAQYGCFDTVIPWNQYLKERVSQLLAVNPFGTYDESKEFGIVENGNYYDTEDNIRYLDFVQFFMAKML